MTTGGHVRRGVRLERATAPSHLSVPAPLLLHSSPPAPAATPLPLCAHALLPLSAQPPTCSTMGPTKASHSSSRSSKLSTSCGNGGARWKQEEGHERGRAGRLCVRRQSPGCQLAVPPPNPPVPGPALTLIPLAVSPPFPPPGPALTLIPLEVPPPFPPHPGPPSP